jgi:hypothetical protein
MNKTITFKDMSFKIKNKRLVLDKIYPDNKTKKINSVVYAILMSVN